MKRFLLVITVLLTCLLAFGMLFLFLYLADRREEKTNNFNQLYSIEPESLMVSLEQGKIDVFVPISEDPPWPPPDGQIPVPWKQEDYLRIANALFESVWNDSIDGWQLNDMGFSLGCAEYGTGFQYANFTFFKNEETNKNKSRIERILIIDPRDKTVYVTENRYSPRLFDWSSIDLNHDQLTANDILQIAEDAGGLTQRLSVENACHISLFLAPDAARYKGWWIRYSQRGDDATLLEADIDPSTGKIHFP